MIYMRHWTLRKRTGDNRFDILVNNAGIGQILTVEEAMEESFDEVMDINVKAVADIAAFLASSDSRWVTGQLIDASGGSHL